MIIDDCDSDRRTHVARMPRGAGLMRLIRKHREPDPALLLLRSVCHEVRPSIATLSSLVTAMDGQTCPERRTEMAGLATQHAAHALSVLAEASAIAAGRSDGPGEGVPLGEILPYVTATVPDGRLRTATSRAAARWPVHRQHTQQILGNLVGNAVDHSPGIVRVDARLRAGRLRLTVADQGGSNPRLVRALHRSTPPPDDIGLGLWVVRHLVATRGGRLRARAGRTAGLVVEVALPRYRG
jgi:signal transduction histidine kinase